MNLNSPNSMKKPIPIPIPNLSLNLSPPSNSNFEAIEFSGFDQSSDSAGSSTCESDMSHDKCGDPSLRLGFDHSLASRARSNLGRQMMMVSQHHHHINGRDFKRSANRAPRMRWTSTLHSHFIHVVQLLGGHERATPKSVLELMNVKDLTLAHVKSHLQMYRTVKSTDKGSILSCGAFREENVAMDQRGKFTSAKSLPYASNYSPINISAENARIGSWLSSAQMNYEAHLNHEGLACFHSMGITQSKENQQNETTEKEKEVDESSSVGSQSTSSDIPPLNLEFTL